MDQVKRTIVKNMLTGEQDIYVNDHSLAENIISSIIIAKKKTSRLLDSEFRLRYQDLVKTSVSKVTGREFAFCAKYELHAVSSKI